MNKARITPAEKLSAMADSADKVVNSVAKSLGVAVGELWTIFVRQYVVRGVNEAFTAVILFVAAEMLKGYIGFYALIPAVAGLALCYGAISLLGNPKYYAIEDIIKRIRNAREW